MLTTTAVSIRPFFGRVLSSQKATICSRTIAMTATTSFQKLTEICHDISALSEIGGILSWDEQVMMPKGSGPSRGKQKAAIASVVHEKATSDALKTAIAEAKKEMDSLNEFERAIVRDAERNYNLKVGVPTYLEREIAKHETYSVQAWVEARENNDFASFAPSLKKMLELIRKKALAMKPDANVYDTFIDMFERGMTADRLSEIFDEIKGPLKTLLEKTLAAKGKCKKQVHPALKGGKGWDVESQAELCKELCDVLGFDFDKGRIDVSVHPFTGGAGPTDVRITTRYSTSVPFEGIMGTIHEAGHAMYEQGRNMKYEGLPASEALSMGVHESQSLFWERMIGQNVAFWESIIDKIHEKLPHTREATAEDFFFATNQVNRSLIRVDADEVTYPFHIILRFELEKKLLDGSLQVDDLPKAWNDGMKELVGIEVPDDSKGCLQDIHWPSGAIGYFPSYTLGAMMAAQLATYLRRNGMPDFDERISKGEYADIRNWLKKEIHQVGSLYPSLDELLIKVTGEPLKPSYFVEYLQDKYANVYA